MLLSLLCYRVLQQVLCLTCKATSKDPKGTLKRHAASISSSQSLGPSGQIWHQQEGTEQWTWHMHVVRKLSWLLTAIDMLGTMACHEPFAAQLSCTCLLLMFLLWKWACIEHRFGMMAQCIPQSDCHMCNFSMWPYSKGLPWVSSVMPFAHANVFCCILVSHLVPRELWQRAAIPSPPKMICIWVSTRMWGGLSQNDKEKPWRVESEVAISCWTVSGGRHRRHRIGQLLHS